MSHLPFDEFPPLADHDHASHLVKRSYRVGVQHDVFIHETDLVSVSGSVLRSNEAPHVLLIHGSSLYVSISPLHHC